MTLLLQAKGDESTVLMTQHFGEREGKKNIFTKVLKGYALGTQ